MSGVGERVWLVRPGRSVTDRHGKIKATAGQTLPWNDADAVRQRAAVVPTFVEARSEAPATTRAQPVVDGSGVWSEPQLERRSLGAGADPAADEGSEEG